MTVVVFTVNKRRQEMRLTTNKDMQIYLTSPLIGGRNGSDHINRVSPEQRQKPLSYQVIDGRMLN
jgi:hypothetical protein